MISKDIQYLKLDSVIVNREERQRRKLDPDHISSLAKQIQQNGLIHAILCEENLTLISGENRLNAFYSLQTRGIECPWPEYEDWTRIPIRTAKNATPTECRIMELCENIHHKALPWQDTAMSIKLIFEAYNEGDDDFSIRGLSHALGLKYEFLQQNLQVAAHLHDPEIADCSSRITALNILKRKQDRLLSSVVEDIDYAYSEESDSKSQLETTEENPARQEEQRELPIQEPMAARPGPENLDRTPPSNFVARSEDFLDWAASYTGPRFNLIHADFPYGVGLHKSSTMNKAGHGKYEDTEEIFWLLFEALLGNRDRILASNCHLLFWHSADDRDAVVARLRDAGFRVWLYPLIWHKSCNTGLFPDSNRGPRHTYEMCTLASLGDRKIVRLVADSWSGPVVRQSGHESEKPIEMLEHFFTMLVDESTTILDPTGGSGNALFAANNKGAKRGLMLELEPYYCDRFNKLMEI